MTTSNQALRQEQRYVRKAAIVIALVFVSIGSRSTPLLAANPVPIINQPLVPGSAAPGGPAFTLTVNGTGFVSGSTVNWNGSPRTTTFVSGSQWDAPYGWAPTEMIAVKGLRHYGFNNEADRITINFLSTILKEFLRTGTILEKYDVEKRVAEVKGLEFGYKSNEIGFGWTNAAFEEMYSELPEDKREFLLNLSGVSGNH